ncbi:hypothetical protein [Salinarchaeum laminariae]|uniref:hypothetical protein n=1 Tax=Salinarchaeum laminariae TaxID=869888 RepID=UPI0020C16F61|nr:hypothetical protein [Salinarchaeum laminariae]
MSVSGLCEVCQSAQAVHRCDRCGTVVCREHFAEALGYCTSCAAEGRGGEGSEDVDPSGDTFQF